MNVHFIIRFPNILSPDKMPFVVGWAQKPTNCEQGKVITILWLGFDRTWRLCCPYTVSGGGERVGGGGPQQEAGQEERCGEHAAAAGIQSTVPAAVQARHQEHAVFGGQSPVMIQNFIVCFFRVWKRRNAANLGFMPELCTPVGSKGDTRFLQIALETGK